MDVGRLENPVCTGETSSRPTEMGLAILRIGLCFSALLKPLFSQGQDHAGRALMTPSASRTEIEILSVRTGFLSGCVVTLFLPMLE
jgi:hypothetical protein